MHQYKLLKEIRDRAFKNYIFDPFDEEARGLFLETNQLYLTTERDEEDNEFAGDFDDDGEETGGFDIFGDDDDDDGTGSQFAFRKVKLSQSGPIDPPFGLKAALCFDSVNDYEDSVLKAIQQMQAGQTEDLLSKAGLYAPFVEDRMNRAKKKYDDVLKDLEGARMSGASMDKRKEFTYNSFLADELGNITKSDLPKELRNKFLSKRSGDLGKYISRDQVGATVTGIGAGELEFLARMFYMSAGGSNPGVASKIKVGESVSRETIAAQEKELLKLAPGTVGYNCLRTLRDYLSNAVTEALQPVVKEIHLDEFIDSGIDHVLDGISQGKYNFENANLAAWAFQVMKNKAKDLLKKVTDYEYDDTNAAKWTSTLTFPLGVYSKANPQAALSLKAKKLLHFASVDTERKFNIKGENDKFFRYVYDNEYDFLEDLRTSNGYYSDAEMGQKETAGRKKKYLEDSPLYYQNLSLEQRKQFMSSTPKDRFLDTQDFPEVSTAEIPEFTPEEREDKAREILESKKLQDYLDNIVNDMYNKIVSSPSAENKYGQQNITAYMKSNEFLTKKLIKGFLNFGVYTFQKDHYQWITSPESYVKEFFDDIYKSEFPKAGIPSTIKSGNKEKSLFQPRVKGVPGSSEPFLAELRRVILGTGKYGYEAVPLLMKGDKESDEEFRKRLMTDPKTGKMKKSAGFLIQHPDYLRNIYKVLSQMAANVIVGRRKPRPVDESAKNIKSLISEISKDLNAYKKQITKNFIKSWN